MRFAMCALVAPVALMLALPLGGCSRRVAGGRADGAAIFAEACAGCHGAAGKPLAAMEAQGVRDLSAPALQARLSDADIHRQIRSGSANRRMPAFEGALTEDQMNAVAAFVRQLAVDAR